MKKLTSMALALGLSAGSLSAIDFASKEGKFIFGNLDIGAGGSYYGVNGKNAKLSNTAGYGVLDGTLFFKSRVQLGARLGIGVGQMTHSDSLVGVNGVSKKKLFSAFVDANLKLGVNVASKSSPLFVNILYGAQGFGGDEKKAMFAEGSWIGLGLESIGRSVAWELGVLGAVPYYMTPNNKDLEKAAKSDKAGLGLHASVKLMRDFNSHIGVFLRLTGKYMDLPSAKYDKDGANITFPKANHYSGMAEVGLSFF